MSEALRSVFNVIERSSINNNYMTSESKDILINIFTNKNKERNSFEGFKKN